MVATILTIIIIILITSRYYLKFSPIKSFVCLMATILGLIISFTFYEPIAGFFISKGFVPQLVQPISFFLLFIVVWGMIEGLLDYIVGTNIDFGNPAKIVTAIVCGFLASLFISGSLMIVLGLSPLRSSIPYARFGETLDKSAMSRASSALIPVDGLVTGLYNIIAKGALGSGRKFGVVHKNFLDQIHLNRYAAKDGVSLVIAEDAAFVEKFGVLKTKTKDDKPLVVVDLWFKNKSIKEGGAKDSEKQVSFTGSQVRLICAPDGQKELTGENIKLIYPAIFESQDDAEKQKNLLSSIHAFSNKMFIKTSKGQAAIERIPFFVPDGYTPRYMQVKANNLIELPKPLTKEEIEEAHLEEAAKNPEE